MYISFKSQYSDSTSHLHPISFAPLHLTLVARYLESSGNIFAFLLSLLQMLFNKLCSLVRLYSTVCIDLYFAVWNLFILFMELKLLV